MPAPPPVQTSGGGGCGGIFVAIVTAVLTVVNPIGGFVGAALDSLAAQGIGIAVGAQKSINWNEVAQAGVSSASSFLAGPYLGPILTQGIDVATGLQKSFNFADVAAAEVEAGVSYGTSLGLDGSQLNAGTGPDSFDISVGTPINRFVSNLSGGFAGAATTSLLSRTDFGSNLLNALPNAIGQTIGNEVAEGIQQAAAGNANAATEPTAGTVNAAGQVNSTASATGPIWVHFSDGSWGWSDQGAASSNGSLVFGDNLAKLMYGDAQTAASFGADSQTVSMLQQRDAIARQILGASDASTTPTNAINTDSTLAKSLQNYYSGTPKLAASYFELQIQQDYLNYVRQQDTNPDATSQIANMQQAIDDRRVVLDAAYAQADQQINTIGKYALAVPLTGALAGFGAGAATAYGTTMLARSAIGAVTNVATDLGTSYLTGNMKTFTLTGVGVDIAVGAALGAPSPDRAIGAVLARPLVGLPLNAGVSDSSNQLLTDEHVDPTKTLENTLTLGSFHF